MCPFPYHLHQADSALSLIHIYAENGNDYVYVYFFDNYTPGTMRMLRDTKGQKTADLITVEERKDTAYAIFTPNGAQAQYAICSPIVDENGTPVSYTHLDVYKRQVLQVNFSAATRRATIR